MGTSTDCTIAAYCIARDEQPQAVRWAEQVQGADHAFVAVDVASTDDTAAVLRANGVTVGDVEYAHGFRYDHARQHALDCLPDVDVCVVVDLDETLEPGFFDILRAEWDRGRFDSAWVWYDHADNGQWTRHLRVHSRYGYRWTRPCHETLVWQGGQERRIESDVAIVHRQTQKDRTHRLDLLRLAVAEDPGDARMWHYLSRDALAAGDPVTCVEAARAMLALPDGWPPERAAVCRYASQADPANQLRWLQRGTREAPTETEAWAALADWHYQRQEWADVLTAAFHAIDDCGDANHYLVDRKLRSWWLLDRAALASYHLGLYGNALMLGRTALAASPNDPQLADNVVWYEAGCSLTS